jgi:hypothetical protein
MSRVSWHLFQDRQPRAHLIVAVIALADGVAGDELTAAQSVLLRLVRKQKPAGAYASTVVRDAGLQEIYLAFEDDGDTKEFAAVVNAKATGSYPGWASQRAFQLDGAKVTTLAPRYRRRRRAPGNRSQRKDRCHAESSMGSVASPEYQPRLIVAGRLTVAALSPQSQASQSQ